MLNDSIYSPRHRIFIFASLVFFCFFFSLMVLSICTPSFSCPSPHVDVAFEKCAVSGHRPGAGVPGSGRGGRLCSECVGDIRANVFQSIDQTVALDGLSKALFLNLC